MEIISVDDFDTHEMAAGEQPNAGERGYAEAPGQVA